MFPIGWGHVHLDGVPQADGFVAEDTVGPGAVGILVRNLMTSESPEFYKFIDKLGPMFLGKVTLPQLVSNFVAVVHPDWSAEVYINDVNVKLMIRPKRAMAAMSPISKSAIADISDLKIEGIPISPTDHLYVCLKAGWRFLLFFDLTRKLDMDSIGKELARAYRYLLFRDEYSMLENQPLFDSLMNDGWFPFTEMLGSDFVKLETAYSHRDEPVKFKAFLDEITSQFNEERLSALQEIWWSYEPLAAKRKIIEEAVSDYLAKKYISCIKVLYSEIEGLIRLRFHAELGSRPTFAHLRDFVGKKALAKYDDPTSLGFPTVFLEYITKNIFADFDLDSGNVVLSRHSAEHGVADQSLYEKEKALQAILVVDQIRFYLY